MSNRFQTTKKLLALALLTIPSCTQSRIADIESPAAVPPAFSTTGDAALPTRWWTALGDEMLDRLIEQAVRENFSLRTAWDRLEQARAVARASGASLLPNVDGTAGASRTINDAGGSRTGVTGISLGVTVSYEVDLWGRVRGTRDATRLDALASEENLRAAAMTLSSEVARTWVTLIEQKGQLRLLAEQIKTNEDYLKLITLRFRRGRVSATDVFQQKQLVESTKGERTQVDSAIAVLRHQLAVLIGKSPGGRTFSPPDQLPDLPPLPATGLPAEWIRRRPDIRAAELRVQAADRRFAAAVADKFPRLTLSARAETTAEEIRDLFDNWLASIAANLIAPLFDGDRRQAEADRTRAVVSERLNAYGQVVLTSLKEVEDALVQEARQREYVASLKRQLALSDQAKTQTRENYIKGTVDFTRYLTTLLGHQNLQRKTLQAAGRLVQYRINLYRALAGSWQLPRPPQARVAGPATRPANDAQNPLQ